MTHLSVQARRANRKPRRIAAWGDRAAGRGGCLSRRGRCLPTVIGAALLVVAAGTLTACGATAGGTINNPFHREEPQPVTPNPIPAPSYDGHVKDAGIWLQSSKETAAFTTFVTIELDLDADPAEWASLIDPTDTRKIVWFVSPFYYTRTARSLNGYVYRDDFPAKWQAVKTLIANHLDRTLAIWLADEPDSVACGDQLDTDGKPCGTPGDGDWNPNLYNADLSRAAAIIHADLPTVRVGVNFGGVPSSLRVADGLDVVGLEAYGVDWAAQLRNLKAIWSRAIVLMPPLFVDGDPDATDPDLAIRVREEYEAAKADPQVIALYGFGCGDDTTTGDKSFFTICGPRLPLTRHAFVDVGTAIARGGQ